MASITTFKSELDSFLWPVIVLDDFFDHPHDLRELALSLDYRETWSAYPGVEASFQIPGSSFFSRIKSAVDLSFSELYGASARLTLAPIIQRDIAPPSSHVLHCRPRPAWAEAIIAPQFRREEVLHFTVLNAFTKDYSKYLPHYDLLVNSSRVLPMSALVYLNTDASAYGGTAFFRHRETGLMAVPAADSPAAAAACKLLNVPDVHELARKITYYSNEPEETWSIEHIVEPKFNRLVCFAGNLLHSIFSDKMAGGGLETARLTINAFFDASLERR